MTVEVSRDVKLALSYVDDAESKFQNLRHEDNYFIVEDRAEDILNGELAKAEETLQKAIDRGEDVLAARIRLVSVQANIAIQVAGVTERLKISNDHKKVWAKWANRAIEKHRELLELAPLPASYYFYGFALYIGDRDREAIQPLREAEKSDDDELSIKATKLIAKIEESLAKAPAQTMPTSSAGNTEKSGPCYIATACYDNFNHPDVLVFRRFRDETLLSSHVGRLLVSIYYRVSPPIARRLGNVKWLSSVVRKYLLEPLARKLR